MRTTYDAEVVHERAAPHHVVRQRLRLEYLDADDPGLRRRDWFDGGDRPLGAAVADLVEARTGRRPAGPVRMLTQRRSLGWLFNPLTTYYCFEADATTLANVVLEVTNTPWHERHWYVLGAGPTSFPKAFHVSPFLPMDLTYRCDAPVPGEHLQLHLEVCDGDRSVLDVRLTGARRATGARPTQALRVSAGIYGHALALRLRGAAYHRHPGHA